MMFRRKQKQTHPEIIINGTSLPRQYWNGDVYRRTVIAKNGAEYAHVDDDGVLSTGKTSSPGRTSVDRIVLEYALPEKDKQIIRADVFLEDGKIYIGKRDEQEGLYQR